MLPHRADHLQLGLLVEHLVGQPAGDDHVRADVRVGAVAAHAVGQVAFGQAEEFVERRRGAFGQFLPRLHELRVARLAGQPESVADGVVPQGVDLHLIAVARGDGTAVDHGVHPREGNLVGRGPHQPVVVERDTARDAPFVRLEHLFHGLAVVFPDLLRADLRFEPLKGPEEPQRGVRGVRRRSVPGEHAVLHAAHLRVEGVDAVLLVVLPQGDARQRDEGLAARNPVPRIARDHLRPVARAADHELPRRVFEAADEVDLVRAARNGAAEDLLDGFRRAHFVERRREDDALALLQFGFEIARGHQVLVAVVAAGDVLPVFEIVVPVGRGHELRAGFAGLEIQPRKRTVEAAFHAVDGRIGVPVGLHVGMRQRMLVAEGEERAQPEARFRMGVDERVADHQLRALVNPEHLLLEDHAAYAIGDRWGRSVLEIGDVLVAARLVGPLETVQRQVERLVVLDDRFVERRQQDVGPVAVVDRGHHQAVVTAGVAADDGRAHIAADTVRCEHFALERVLQIAQFAFVESKC